jgi:hypothetical protein
MAALGLLLAENLPRWINNVAIGLFLVVRRQLMKDAHAQPNMGPVLLLLFILKSRVTP